MEEDSFCEEDEYSVAAAWIPPEDGSCLCVVEINEIIANPLHHRFDELPEEVLLHLYGYLRAESLARASAVCKRWRILTADPYLWRHLALTTR